MGDRIRPPYCLEPQGAAGGSQIFKISEPTAADSASSVTVRSSFGSRFPVNCSGASFGAACSRQALFAGFASFDLSA